MATKVKLLRIEDQVVYRVGGGQGASTLVGYGFVYDNDGNEHGVELEACVLKSNGLVCEDANKIKVEQPKPEYKNNTRFEIKITVEPPDPQHPYPANFYGHRKVVIKKKGEALDANGDCPAGSTTCSALLNAIRIKPADA